MGMYGILTEETAPAEQVQRKFKVGQRVRFTDACDSTWWFKAGECGVISHAGGHGVYPYEVSVDDDRGTAFVSAEHIESAFLRGDKVRVTRHSGYFAVGDTGEVERQADATVFVKHGHYSRIGLPIDADSLEWLESAADCGDRNGQMLEWRITNSDGAFAVGSAGAAIRDHQPCIVALTKNGQPLPATRPYIHASVASATTEAERLAKNNPGQEFAVYQRVAGRVAEVSYEMKEVA